MNSLTSLRPAEFCITIFY